MPISIRLDKRTESLLEETANALQTSKAEVIRRSLSEYCSKISRNAKPYDLIKDLLGREGSGKGDLSVRGEEILRARLKRNR